MTTMTISMTISMNITILYHPRTEAWQVWIDDRLVRVVDYLGRGQTRICAVQPETAAEKWFVDEAIRKHVTRVRKSA